MDDPVDELAALRAENEMLRAHLAAADAECNVLRGIASARASDAIGARPRTPVERPQIGSRERMALLENTVDVLEAFVRERASWDCYGCDYEDGIDLSQPGINLCEPCSARAVIARMKAYRFGGSREVPSRRFIGAMYSRIEAGWDQREIKIHRAWSEHMTNAYGDPDRLLALILTDRHTSGSGLFEGPLDWPTPRDWYVATSVVQWLATTVGGSILEQAGWKYTQHDDDIKVRDAKRARGE